MVTLDFTEQASLLTASLEGEPAGELREDLRVDIDPHFLAENWGDMSQNPELLLLAEEAAEHYHPAAEALITTEDVIMNTTTTETTETTETTTATRRPLFDMDLAEMRALLQQDATPLVMLTPEQIGNALLLEAVKFLAQQAADPAKDYQVFNKAVCKVWREDTAALQRLAVTALRGVNAARQTGEDAAITAAQRQVELLAMLIRQVAGSVIRGGFYKHREATKLEERNASNAEGSGYAAPILAEFTSDDVITACGDVSSFLEQVFFVLVPATSRWFQSNAAIWSLGRDALADGSYIDLPGITEVWQMLARKANTKIQTSGKDAAASLLQAFGAGAAPLLMAAEPDAEAEAPKPKAKRAAK